MKKKGERETVEKELPAEQKAVKLLKGVEMPPFLREDLEGLEKPVFGPDGEELRMQPADIRKQRVAAVKTAVALELITREHGDEILAVLKGREASGGRKKAKPKR